jgi:hydrogenase-4 component E
MHAPSIAAALAGTVSLTLLLVQLGMLRSLVLGELIALYAIQSLVVALVCATVGATEHALDLVILAGITLVAKVFVLPFYMRSLARRVSTRVEIPARVNVTLSLLIAAALAGVAMLTASRLPLHGGTFLPAANFATALSIVLIGFLIAILRPNALAQVVAFLTLENGLFFATITLAPGLPLVIGVLLLIDVLIAVFVFAVLVRILVSARGSMHTGLLETLRG